MNLAVATAGCILVITAYILTRRGKASKHELNPLVIHKPHKERLCQHTDTQLVVKALQDHVLVNFIPLIDIIVDYWGNRVLEDYNSSWKDGMNRGFILSYPRYMTYNPAWGSCVGDGLCGLGPGALTFAQDKLVRKGMIRIQWFIRHLNSIRLKYEPLIGCSFKLVGDSKERTFKIGSILLTINDKLQFYMALYLQAPHKDVLALYGIAPIMTLPHRIDPTSDEIQYRIHFDSSKMFYVFYKEEWILLSSILDPGSDWFCKEIHDPITVH